MGDHSAWLTYITDPSAVPAEVMQALTALDVYINQLYEAENIEYAYTPFYGAGVTDVATALNMIGDALDTGLTVNLLLAIPSRGAVLVDGTSIFAFIVPIATDLAKATVKAALEVAPAGAPTTITLIKNGVTVKSFDFAIGQTGPVVVDLTGITVVAGDIITAFCITASAAAGFMLTAELVP